MELFFPKSAEAWYVEGIIKPEDLLQNLDKVCQPDDRLIFGSYDTSVEAQNWMIGLGALSPHPPQGIHLNCRSYDYNRTEYPYARAFELTYSDATIESLLRLCKLPKAGGSEKDIFYDDFAAYRPSSPPSPLIDFNHATSGGALYLHESIPADRVHALAVATGGSAAKIAYPPRWGSA
jgi:hypothetical protein